jgi:Zn-dependent M16 (insulinase) family peptidase
VNRKSGEVVMEGVSIEKMYTLKQSILNILYKNIIEDIEQEKVFMAKVSY